MERFHASSHYGDWKGTAAADGSNNPSDSFDEYLEREKLLEPDDFLIAVKFWAGEINKGGRPSCFVHAYALKGYEDGDQARAAVVAAKDPLRVKEIKIELPIDEFFHFFKEFSISLAPNGFDLQKREFWPLEE